MPTPENPGDRLLHLVLWLVSARSFSPTKDLLCLLLRSPRPVVGLCARPAK